MLLTKYKAISNETIAIKRFHLYTVGVVKVITHSWSRFRFLLGTVTWHLNEYS